MTVADEALPRAKRPSIYDVAERAGVSHMTVSRVLNGGAHIREETRARVEAAIAETDYRPSSAARTLATHRTMKIGALVGSPFEHGPKSTLFAVEKSARQHHYAIVTYSQSSTSPQEFEAGLIDLADQGVDAICVIGPRTWTTAAVAKSRTHLPIVVVGGDPDNAIPHVDIDQAQGAAAALDHLLGLGHRSILHLAGPADFCAAQQRALAYTAAMRRARSAVRIIEGDWSPNSGYRVGADPELIGDCTAVFAGNDQMALGLVHGAWSRGIEVPRDLSVVGFDDLPGAAHFIPPLTTVRQDLDRLGEMAVESVLAAIEGRSRLSMSLPAELIVRASTAAVRVR